MKRAGKLLFTAALMIVMLFSLSTTASAWALADQAASGLSAFLDSSGNLGLKDDAGKIVLPCAYSDLSYCKGLLIASLPDSEKYGIISLSGQVLYPFQAERISPLEPKDGLFRIQDAALSNGKDAYSLYKLGTGEIVLPKQYQSFKGYGDGCFIVQDSTGKYGLVDWQGNILLPFSYDMMQIYDTGYGKTLKYGVLNGGTDLIGYIAGTPVYGDGYDWQYVSLDRYKVQLPQNEMFLDVFQGDYYYDAVKWAIEQGIVDANSVCLAPNQEITRLEMVTLMWRAFGEPREYGNMKNVFTDNKVSTAFGRSGYDAVLWAYYNGITSGTTETLFSPNLICSRAQVMTFLWSAQGKETPSVPAGFTDVAVHAWYADAVTWAVENGITTGTSATTFSPDSSCTRAQILTFMYKAFGT